MTTVEDAKQRMEEALDAMRREFASVRTGKATPAQQQRQEAESRQAAAVDAIESDPNVKAIQKAFDATLHTESIRPLDSQ